MKYPSKRPAIRKTIVVSGVSTNSKNEETKLNSYGSRGYEAVTDKLGRTKVTLDVPSDAVSIIVKVSIPYGFEWVLLAIGIVCQIIVWK